MTAADPVPIGAEFTSNPTVRKITFTGSTAVGKKLAADAAAQLKRVSMELGGHAPFLVFEDADPVHAAKGASLVKFLNTGQACISPNRLFVHSSIVEPFVETLTQRVVGLLLGMLGQLIPADQAVAELAHAGAVGLAPTDAAP